MNKKNQLFYHEYLELLKKSLLGTLYDESCWEILYDNKKRLFSLPLNLQFLRDFIINLFLKKNILLVKKKPFNLMARLEGRGFTNIGYTMTSKKRLDHLQECIENIIDKNVEGDFIETGVWRGGSTIFMRALLKVYEIKDRSVWVADSFSGMPKPKDKSDGSDLSKFLVLNVSLEQVKSNFEKYDLLDDQVKFLKGWFKDTLPKAPIKKLSLIRLDGDLYSSTMDSLNNLYNKLSLGGYVLIDEYYDWPECKRAVDEFRKENSISDEIKKIDWSSAFWEKKS